MRGGFSLIEALVVIAIAGVLFAVGIPNYLSWRATTQTRQGAQQLARAVDDLRTSVRRSDTEASITLTHNSDQFSISDDSGTRTIGLPSGTILSTSPATVAFTFEPPYGSLSSIPSGGFTDFEVVWESDASISSRVIVAGVMGRTYLP